MQKRCHSSLWEGIKKVAAMLARAVRLPSLEPGPSAALGLLVGGSARGGADCFYAFQLIRTWKDLLLEEPK